MMTGFGMGFSYFGLFLMVLFWGGLIALAVLAVRTLFHSSSHDRNFPSTANPTARRSWTSVMPKARSRARITSV